MKKVFTLGLFSLWCCLSVFGQTSREEMYENLNKTGGVYYAYPVSETQNTKAPKGYKPFYISHYGRHGSRFLISQRDYYSVYNVLEKADKAGTLTALGKNLMGRIVLLCQEAEGTEGNLTPLGRRQHRGIAERMFKAYPEVFEDRDSVSARSTIVHRCAMSMVAFGDMLKELNPNLTIFYEMSEKHMDYLNYHTDESNVFTNGENGPWVEEYRKFFEENTNPDRLVSSLFNDENYIRKNVHPSNLMWGLYWIASDVQDMETKAYIYDVFEKEELFDLWQINNYRMYVGNANHPGGKGLVVGNAKNLMKNIIESADEAIENPRIAATLRFGHDGNITPLCAFLEIGDFNVQVEKPEELYKYWCDFKVSPMASNVQIVFFNKKNGNKDDILVKVLHNESEVCIPVKTDRFPFYKWTDFREFYYNKLK